MAELHCERITEGFLPTLGLPFLERLYHRIVRSPDACAFVVEDAGKVVAFAAGATDTGRLYRSFIARDGFVAGLRSAPRLVRSGRRVWETLRYPASTASLPAAEVLAVATSTAAGGLGLGSRAVRAVTADLAARGAEAVKVTVGAENAAALRMYERCGFAPATRVEVHGGHASEVLVWTAP